MQRQRSESALVEGDDEIRNFFVVDGQPVDGPDFCPAEIAFVPHEDPWVLADHTADPALREFSTNLVSLVCQAQ